MILSVATALLLLLFTQNTEGSNRLLKIRKMLVHDGSFNDDDGVYATTVTNDDDSESDIFTNLCCVYGNCSCSFGYSPLTHLTSNVVINITTDVKLSSVIPLIDLANITITGHNNPTVFCNNSGGLHFISCHNCTIEGITWKGCGGRDISDNNNIHPVLQLYNSSNIISYSID